MMAIYVTFQINFLSPLKGTLVRSLEIRDLRCLPKMYK